MTGERLYFAWFDGTIPTGWTSLPPAAQSLWNLLAESVSAQIQASLFLIECGEQCQSEVYPVRTEPVNAQIQAFGSSLTPELVAWLGITPYQEWPDYAKRAVEKLQLEGLARYNALSQKERPPSRSNRLPRPVLETRAPRRSYLDRSHLDAFHNQRRKT